MMDTMHPPKQDRRGSPPGELWLIQTQRPVVPCPTVRCAERLDLVHALKAARLSRRCEKHRGIVVGFGTLEKAKLQKDLSLNETR